MTGEGFAYFRWQVRFVGTDKCSETGQLCPVCMQTWRWLQENPGWIAQRYFRGKVTDGVHWQQEHAQLDQLGSL